MNAVSPPPRPGTRAGRPNKVPRVIKDVIMRALIDAGGTSYLVHIAKKHPKIFCALLGKLIARSNPSEAANNIVVEIVQDADSAPR